MPSQLTTTLVKPQKIILVNIVECFTMKTHSSEKLVVDYLLWSN